MGLPLPGCLSLWASLSPWTSLSLSLFLLDVSVFGPISSWMSLPLGLYLPGCLCLWAYLSLDASVFGPISPWMSLSFGLSFPGCGAMSMSPSVPKHLGRNKHAP